MKARLPATICIQIGVYLLKIQGFEEAKVDPNLHTFQDLGPIKSHKTIQILPILPYFFMKCFIESKLGLGYHPE